MESLKQVSGIRKKSELFLVKSYHPLLIDYISRFVDIEKEKENIITISDRFDIEAQITGKRQNLINLALVNEAGYINKFFETVNKKLKRNALFIGCFESSAQRKKKFFNKFPLLIANLFYLVDFIWMRAFPKMKLTRNLYFRFSKRKKRVLSIPEVLGRLVSCGFTIESYEEVAGKIYFCAKKTSKPKFDLDPTFGLLISLNRVGQAGKGLKVYKFRTMHPYSEYLQEFIYEQNKLQNGGKFKDDFRVAYWGAYFRKFWIDELPMLYNWLRRDVKLVGVRPLSRQYLELYPEKFQKTRVKYKPGLIPPFYFDLPETFDEIFESEKKYLAEYDKHPIRTDCMYFIKSLYNIFIKRARSK